MQLEEGQVYEGGISLSGGDGPFRRWLVVSPFGKTHIHCVDDPLALHCWPATLVQSGIESGRLRYVDKRPDHPAIQVQRLKEKLGVHDAHLSISEQTLERLLDALRTAVNAGEAYASYLAGEILSAVSHSALLINRCEQITATVHAVLGDGGFAVPRVVPVGVGATETGSMLS
ncbi:MAG: hypothetical protein HZB57_13595 [Gammaproteobacteria bacterium]|nr:hypothetical protein [Gammaproteobacteria bacterium]